MIYTPAYFDAKAHGDLVTELVRAHNFGMLLMHLDDKPVISHLPFLYEPASAPGAAKLFAHVARPNPQARLISSGCHVTAVFQGPHAYISPRWYEPAPDHVPTWNYAVVHMHGVAHPLEGDAAYAAMQELVRVHDPEWPLALSGKDKRALMQGILVFCVEVQNIDAKFKLSQNRTEEDQRSVMSALEQSSPGGQGVARLMRQVLIP